MSVIKTKFSLGERIFFMKDNKVDSFEVWKIDITHEKNFNGEFVNGTRTKITYIDFNGNTRVKEENAFASKEDLINSL